MANLTSLARRRASSSHRLALLCLSAATLGACAQGLTTDEAGVNRGDAAIDASTVDVGDASVSDVGDAGTSDAEIVDPYRWWRDERAARDAALDAYLAANDDGLRAMLYSPLGSFGIPRTTLDAFSTVMPDRWGPPAEKFAAVGLGPDLHDPTNPLPLGIASFVLGGVEYAMFSCGACHVGRVVGPDGNERLLFGAPNTRFNSVFNAFEDTAADSRYGALGGGVPATTIQAALVLRRQVEVRTIAGITFDRTTHPNAADPFSRDRAGYFDSFAQIFAMQTLPEALLPGTDATLRSIMPPAPGESDIMSLFLQRVRPRAEWDGSLPNAVYRNLAASVGAVGFGFAANYDVAVRVAAFSQDLPPPPYPFDVDGPSAMRGATLFTQYCGTCHQDGATTIFPPSLTGTDANRAWSVTAAGRTRLIKALRGGCTDSTVCNVPDDEVVADVSAGAPRGYLALPLHGLWTRAPYLHNGSVPTLAQLLVPSTRPSGFYRGSLHYDTTKVGFAWDASAAGDPYVQWFDTSLAGRSNGGHDSMQFLGLDWSTHPNELADLLEYLKTL